MEGKDEEGQKKDINVSKRKMNIGKRKERLGEIDGREWKEETHKKYQRERERREGGETG